MAGEPIITVVGNIAGDPELRFTPSGKAVCNFTVASTPRVKSASGEWEDGETTWLRCAVWDKPAENVAESLESGTRVIVQGRLSSRSYDTREGEKRTALELAVDAIGPELRWATARVTKANSGSNGAAQRSRPAQQSQAYDPWATPNTTEEPPF